MRVYVLLIAVLTSVLVAATQARSATNAPQQSQKIVATVFGNPVFADEPEPTAKIWQPLIDRYVAQNHLEPTEAETKQFNEIMNVKRAEGVRNFKRRRQEISEQLKSPQLNEAAKSNLTSQIQTLDKILNVESKVTAGYESFPQVAKHAVTMWKFNKSLYEKYGGRVIFQQFGIEPLDGYKRFLQEQEANGAFQILDATFNAEFWKYFTTTPHTEVRTKDPFAKPWWLITREEAEAQAGETSTEHSDRPGVGDRSRTESPEQHAR